MPFHPTSILCSRCLLFGFAALLLGAVLVAPASGQDVWVDFTSDFQDGSGGVANGVADWIDELNEATTSRGVADFTAAERQTIQTIIISELERIYAGTNITFVTSQPSGDHDVIYLGPDNSGTGSLGVAPGDAGNRNTNTYAEAFNNGNPNSSFGGVPRVFTGSFDNHIGFGGSRSASVQGFANAIAGTAAHELGHSFGLLHHYVYSADGISLDDADTNNIVITGGLQTQHIMSTGSTGNTAAIRVEGGRTLAPFSQVLIDIAGGSTFLQQFNQFDNTPLVNNHIISDNSELGNNDAGATLETAQSLSFQTGTLSGKEISFVEADLDGASDVDVFRFDTTVDSILSAHVLSEQLGLGNDEFDPTLTLYDSSGTELAFADDVDWALNNSANRVRVSGTSNDGSSSQDAFLFNIELPPGTYFLKVAPAQTEIGQAANIDDIYWLVTSLELLGTEVLLGDMNGNGEVNNLDIAGFALALFNRAAYIVMFPETNPDQVGDFTGDGVMNNLDIFGFAAALGF